MRYLLSILMVVYTLIFPAIVAHSVSEGISLKEKNTLFKLADCESDHDPIAINENDNGSPSYGKFQYKLKTFKWLVVKYNLLDPKNLEEADWINWIMDGQFQTELTLLVIRNEPLWQNHWLNCSNSEDLW